MGEDQTDVTARHGPKAEDSVAAVNVVRLIYGGYILAPKEMTADAKW